MGRTARPLELLVDQAGLLEDADESVVGPVHVANGDDAFDAGELAGGRRDGVRDRDAWRRRLPRKPRWLQPRSRSAGVSWWSAV
jgi:hypothetical protein